MACVQPQQQKMLSKRPSVSDEGRRVKRQLSDRTLTAHMLDRLQFEQDVRPIPPQTPASPEEEQSMPQQQQLHPSGTMVTESPPSHPESPALPEEEQPMPPHQPPQTVIESDIRQDVIQDTESRLPWGLEDDTDFCLGDEESCAAISGGQDEADGIGDIGRKMKDAIHHVAGKGCHAIQSFRDFLHHHHLHLHSHRHHHQHQHQADDEGFPVHLPGQLLNADSMHLGARLLPDRAKRGYRLTRVLPNTVAHKVGLRVTDVLTHLNDIELRNKDVTGILETFMKVEKTFSLTILREVGRGDEARWIEMTIQVTITLDGANNTIEFEVEVFSSKDAFILVAVSNEKFITQDLDGESEVYLNAYSNGVVEMGTKSDEEGIFHLDIYDICSTSAKLVTEGQYCVIRNVKTNMAFDAVAGKMKTMSQLQSIPHQGDENLCFLLNKLEADNTSVYFRSMQEEDKCLFNSSGMLTLKRCDKPSLEGYFKLYPVKK